MTYWMRAPLYTFHFILYTVFMTWASRRRLLIILIVLVVIGGISFWHYSPVVFRAPECTDGVQNGTETGVDCGGSCTTVCTSDIKLPTVSWSRSFAVTDSVYNAVAYVVNKNDAGTRALPYEFRLYDTNDILVARRDGVALIPPLGRYAIVETGITVGTAKVLRTTFDFSATPVLWEKIPDAIKKLNLSTSAVTFYENGPIPRLNALLTNTSPTATLRNTKVAAILYGADDNAVHVSQTFIQTLSPLASAPVSFTWPRAFDVPVVRYEIIPVIDVFDVQ